MFVLERTAEYIKKRMRRRTHCQLEINFKLSRPEKIETKFDLIYCVIQKHAWCVLSNIVINIRKFLWDLPFTTSSGRWTGDNKKALINY